ncbi:UvrB/UvrC motif-containing protein [Sphingomonas sp. VDB2]|uniref:UvrB/UvrC motif-containing protein n=1 Tax=Sphingomonas sp. VDB2 TaxID=3228751 RepID=UPI003A80E963
MTRLEELRHAMDAAAAALNFDEAARLRDMISLVRAGGDQPATDIDPQGLKRQQPGAMGLGTSQQRVRPPAGWVRPKKPDPMTRGRSRRAKGLSKRDEL